ncbi:Variable major protein (plasmid) [Borrelia nietonii YOR]|uniref:Variable large protein n=1 Tax=Borrelia nietonii YOR TaxID=1293576 RepID=W5SBK3_9SPIR|nr:Variable major protein [Borrelia nietonii YOR]
MKLVSLIYILLLYLNRVIKEARKKMRKRISAIIMTLFMVLASCSNQLEAEKLAAENKNTFFDSLVKIGQGFQDIFGILGNAIGDALGFNAVKSGDKRSKVGEHFEGIGKGLKNVKVS